MAADYFTTAYRASTKNNLTIARVLNLKYSRAFKDVSEFKDLLFFFLKKKSFSYVYDDNFCEPTFSTKSSLDPKAKYLFRRD